MQLKTEWRSSPGDLCRGLLHGSGWLVPADGRMSGWQTEAGRMGSRDRGTSCKGAEGMNTYTGVVV
eukprot:1154846-Alexandrium_andersonii.AAC.1